MARIFKNLFTKKDPFETELRNVVYQLLAYEQQLQKELKRFQPAAAVRATEIEKTREECRKKLMLLYSWALSDLLDTYYKQAVLLMKRVWLKSLLDTAAMCALSEKIQATFAWR